MNRKQRIRSRFEFELVSFAKKLSRTFLGENIDTVSQEQESLSQFGKSSMQKQLLMFLIKLILVVFVLYFSINKMAHDALDAVSDSFITKKGDIHQWLITSIKDEGVVYALIDGYHDPVMTNSLAKYFLRIGDDTIAIKLAKLSLRLSKQPTQGEIEASNRKILTDVLGHE